MRNLLRRRYDCTVLVAAVMCFFLGATGILLAWCCFVPDTGCRMSLQPCALLALKSLLYGKLYFFNFEVSSAAFLAVSSALHFATSGLPSFIFPISIFPTVHVGNVPVCQSIVPWPQQLEHSISKVFCLFAAMLYKCLIRFCFSISCCKLARYKGTKIENILSLCFQTPWCVKRRMLPWIVMSWPKCCIMYVRCYITLWYKSRTHCFRLINCWCSQCLMQLSLKAAYSILAMQS